MRKSSKIIYWTSLVLIFFFVIIPFVGRFTPLEFANDNHKTEFEEIRFFGLPIAILLTLFGTLKPEGSTAGRVIKIILTIFMSILSFFFLFMSAFGNMCAWTYNKTLFDRINDKTTKIVLRDFGCGATDSGSPTYKTFKIKNITPLLIWVTDVDTTKIDKQVWHRVENTK